MQLKTINTILSFLLSAVLMLLMTSCDKNQGQPSYMGFNYFGHTAGAWVIYDVDSIVYDDFLNEVFQYNYQVKEVNAGFFVDSQNDSVMRLERFFRANPEDTWKHKNVWSAKLIANKAIKTEENVSYLKITFPAKRNQSWNGNAFNNMEAQNYIITHIHEPLEVGNMLFDSTMRILQKDFSTLIGEDLQYEIYGSNIGMLIKKYIELSKEIDGTIIRGVDYTYTIAEYGVYDPESLQ